MYRVQGARLSKPPVSGDRAILRLLWWLGIREGGIEMRKVIAAGIVAYVGAILLNLALLAGVIWAAVHFIRKFW